MVTTFRLRYCLLLFFPLVMAYEECFASATPRAINSLKVAYIYNIAKFTRWPDATWNSPTAPFQLCFYSKDRMDEELQTLQQKEISGHPIVLLQPESKLDFQQCNVFYINTSERNRYRYILSLINQKTVLIISDDSPFFDSGGLINLVEIDQRLRFQVNRLQLVRSELQFSSKLLKLAILVDNPR
ncbi:MAG: hypothetical protein ACJAT7_000141 [Psychromonas sp.]|jgi:hypothetical protein|uniref:YfiR family protein n=1 Tax=Psychromonas sp. TaxID=1884585 RepID=UPI0039E5CFFF